MRRNPQSRTRAEVERAITQRLDGRAIQLTAPVGIGSAGDVGSVDAAGNIVLCVLLDDHTVTLAAYDTTYSIEADFSAYGLFGSTAYVATMTADQDDVTITEDAPNKTTGIAAWTVSVATGAPSGSYGGPLDLRLSVRVCGTSWTGGPGPYSATWSAPI